MNLTEYIEISFHKIAYEGKDILDEVSAVSYMQMTSYRINVCHATSIVPVESHIKYQISF
jgi:hypothetical protein